MRIGKLILLMLNPWFDNGNQGPFYCPDCGIVEGFLAYNLDIRKQLEIIYVDYKRPRPKIIEYLGEENQDSPVLVLDNSNQIPDGAKKSFFTGKIFVDDPILMCNYLGLKISFELLRYPGGTRRATGMWSTRPAMLICFKMAIYPLKNGSIRGFEDRLGCRYGWH